MPIMSYLAYPTPGQKTHLVQSLTALPECRVIPASNQALLVLLTDTLDELAEEHLQTQLEQISSLQCLALVAGFSGADAAEDRPSQA